MYLFQGADHGSILCAATSCVCRGITFVTDTIIVATEVTRPNSAVRLSNNNIRPHRSTTYVDAVYCYRPSSVVCRSVGHTMSRAKTAEPIEMPFRSRTRLGPGNHVLHGGPGPPMVRSCYAVAALRQRYTWRRRRPPTFGRDKVGGRR